MATKHWKELVADKITRHKAEIPQKWILGNIPSQETLNVIDFPERSGLLSDREIEITNSEVGPLLELLANGSWSAVEVTTAFCKRAVIAHQLVNCLTEIFIERALARASELDEHFKATETVVGPLHGLPISLKDQINVKGIESTMGYVSWINQYAAKNSVLVDILESCGAVLYVKTNIPQTLMWPETFNHIFGRTSNPYNRSLTSGGSSGGEGALVALRGSSIGIGSDIGGSIRVPAGFNGVFGLRPSYNRVPYAGCVNSLEGQDSVPSVLGPLSNSLAGIKVFMKAVASQQPWLKDPLAVRKPWNEAEYDLIDHGQGKKLCFAILWDDEHVVPHPPIIRGLEETKQALLAAGHQVIDWKPLKHEEIYQTLLTIWNAGASDDFRVATAPSSEPLIASMGLALENTDAETQEALRLLTLTDSISAYELWQIHKRKLAFRQEYLDYWNSTVALTGTERPVDAIISPVAPHVASPHGEFKFAQYTMVWNALDYPALVIPTGSYVDESVDVKKPPHQFYNDSDKANYEFYEPAVFRNAPICIQVIGRTLEEEAVIRMGEIVDNALKTRIQGLKL